MQGRRGKQALPGTINR